MIEPQSAERTPIDPTSYGIICCCMTEPESPVPCKLGPKPAPKDEEKNDDNNQCFKTAPRKLEFQKDFYGLISKLCEADVLQVRPAGGRAVGGGLNTHNKTPKNYKKR
jgi:hypothetical protein